MATRGPDMVVSAEDSEVVGSKGGGGAGGV